MNKIPALAIVLVAIGLGSLVISLTYTAAAYDPMPFPNWGSQGSQGMMGQSWNGMFNMMGNGNGMMGGMMNTAVPNIDNVTFNSINTPPIGVTVNKAKNIVFINTTDVTIPIEAAPLWYPRSGEFWLVYHLVNPTIMVKKGAEVDFLFINMDNETHVPSITTMSPPYPYMPMMNGMMNSNTWFQIGWMLPGVATYNGNANVEYSSTTLAATFSATGTYWYPCVYLNHAQMGMYGEIQVVD
ncbi:MAG: hypothetical protein ACLPY5_07095 [Candidatus Bathyarchaeia archaeon]